MKDMIDRTSYKCPRGVARWASKDGLWHIARRYEPTADDRVRFPTSYPAGDNGPFFRYTGEEYSTRERAIEALRG